MHQQSSFPDCCSSRHMNLFLFIHLQWNSWWSRLNWLIVTVMMFISRFMPLHHTAVHLKSCLHTWMNIDSAIPSASSSSLPQYETTVFMDVSERENPLLPSLLVAPHPHLLHSSLSTHAFPSSTPASLTPDFLLSEQHQEGFKCARDADDSPGFSLLTIRWLFSFSLGICG